MSRKLVKATYLFKRLTGIVGVVGVSSLVGLPAWSQNNTTLSQSSPNTPGEVCVVPSRTISSSGISTDMRNMGDGTRSGTSNDMREMGGGSGTADVQGTAGSMGEATGTQGTTTGNADTSNTQGTGSGTADVQGTAGSMGDATGGNMGTANRPGTGSSSTSTSMMQGMIVCGTPTTPDATNRQSNQ